MQLAHWLRPLPAANPEEVPQPKIWLQCCGAPAGSPTACRTTILRLLVMAITV